jgi:capsid protein
MKEPNIEAIISNQPFYEKAIGAVAPSWALSRMQARVQKTLFEYQAAQSNRLFAPKTWGVPAESSRTVRDRKVMMWEARDLVENFPDIFTALGKFSNNCAPTEFTPNTGDAAYNEKVAEYFHEWCKTCDVTGRHSFRKLMQLALEMRPVDGDCGFAFRNRGGDIKIDLIAGDRIGNPNEVVIADNYLDGIVVDDAGKPVAYRIYRVTKEGTYTDPQDISAPYFRHYFDPFRNDQYRGVSAFHAVINTARMLKGILDAEMVGSKFASQQAALVFNERGSAPTRNLFQQPTNTLPTGQPRQDEFSDYGTIKYMATGDRVEIMPSRPGTAFQGFVDHLNQEIARGLDIPFGVLFGTAGYRGPNVRAEFAQADRVWDRHRGILADKVLDPTKDAVILNAIANGDLPMPPAISGESPVQALRRAVRGEWRWPAKMSIDAGRDSAANLNEHRQGILSGQQIAAEQGYDYWATLEQKASEAAKIQELAKRYGVPETAIQLTTSSLPSTPAAAAAAGDNVAASAAKAQAESVPGQAGAVVPGAPVVGADPSIEAFPDVSTEISPLNGAQIEAVISIVEQIRAGAINADAAELLMISAGMAKESAARVAKSVSGMPKPAQAALSRALSFGRGTRVKTLLANFKKT